MQSRLLPVIFYTTVLVTVICQLVAMDALVYSSAGPEPVVETAQRGDRLATDANPVFWEASRCNDCYDLRAGQELPVEQLCGMLNNWSEYSRNKLANLLRVRQPEGDRLRLVFQASARPDGLRYTQLTPQEVGIVLSALHPRS